MFWYYVSATYFPFNQQVELYQNPESYLKRIREDSLTFGALAFKSLDEGR
jgi:hypothetical protein